MSTEHIVHNDLLYKNIRVQKHNFYFTVLEVSVFEFFFPVILQSPLHFDSLLIKFCPPDSSLLH